MASYEGHQAKRQRLSENGASSATDEYRGEREHKFREGPDQPNKVLLFTIMNAVYPITTEVIHTICEPCGEVQRIVIFRKRGVQAMVEFNSIQSAQRAKASLNGADIYSGCCTLKIEWAKPARLNVYKNDDETWDYTGALDAPETPSQPALLGDAPAGYSNAPGYGARPPRSMPGRGRPMMPRGRGMMPPRPPRPGLMGVTSNNTMGGGDYMEDYGGQDMGGFNQSPVLMVYGLNPDKMNCDRLFNILCLYGNVMKIKFLKSKPGTAMVQMGNPAAVERAIGSLSGMKFFDDKMVVGHSKQMYLTDTGAPVSEQADGSPSQMDYSNSRNNRFTTTEQAAKNRIQNPSKVLHYYNAPVDFDEDKMKEICTEFSLVEPKKFTPFKSKSERSSSGLMEFETKPEALEVLTMVNHYKMENPNGRFPYILKLCFSTSSTATRE
uniref:Heterogeneous nuclear ribonucleoprotein L-like n=1 Tax=Phallusia mammillata TaxID=59560 RepID=A0A6F9DE40_9ASCI|nr:heterogeneous nuclear ribonucleoprotein L-like [Phallusia mammillata]